MTPSSPTDITGHRPWPLPDRPWVMRQEWHHLLFAHWPVPAERLHARIPAGLELEEHDGSAWVGIVPFLLRGLRGRGLPGIPTASTFPELNLRTYVSTGGKPGVLFFSLDAASRLAVMGARAAFHLPYHHASMHIGHEETWVRFTSRRLERGGAELRARYRPTGEASAATPGTLDYFLTERYCLYSVARGGGLLRAEIHHPPWPLQPAEAVIERNSLAQASGIELPERLPLLHFARRQEMVNWLPEAVEGGGDG